jgi:hypothetical protein
MNIKYWLRINGFRKEQFGTGERRNPLKGRMILRQLFIYFLIPIVFSCSSRKKEQQYQNIEHEKIEQATDTIFSYSKEPGIPFIIGLSISNKRKREYYCFFRGTKRKLFIVPAEYTRISYSGRPRIVEKNVYHFSCISGDYQFYKTEYDLYIPLRTEFRIE